MDSQKRHWLLLDKKIEVISNYEGTNSISKLTKDIEISRYQRSIIARKEETKKKWENGGKSQSKRVKERQCHYRSLQVITVKLMATCLNVYLAPRIFQVLLLQVRC